MFYVIRGTTTKPEHTLGEDYKGLQEAQEKIAQAAENLIAATDAIKGMHIPKQPMQNPESTRELLVLVEQLQNRVRTLEQKQGLANEDAVKHSEGIKRTLAQLSCGGLAGAVSRSSVAPIDRVKILMQTQHLTNKGQAAKYVGITGTLRTIAFEEGISKLWRGNVTNVIRVVPYSATQFTSYDFYKSQLVGDSGRELGKIERLCAGALAGMTATSLTHPLDVIRLRLNVQPELTGAIDACRSIMAEGGARTFFKGYVPTLLSLSPFIGINFATFDILKKTAFPNGDGGTLSTLGLGATAGIFAQTCCFPLDTVRRRMQLKGVTYTSTGNAFVTILKEEGITGFYKGMAPNAVKVIPNNAIRFLVYDFLTKNKASPFHEFIKKAKLI